MHILIVGNVLKDVYLNLDSRTELFEQDSAGHEWLNLGFNASDHHFFNRTSSFGGAAVSLEVLQKMGLTATIANSNLCFDDSISQAATQATNDYAYRYILTSDHGVSYLVPSKSPETTFITPEGPVDYLYIDRSAHLSPSTIDRIIAYLDYSKNTVLILYIKNETELPMSLLKRAGLIFIEKTEDQTALQSSANNNFNNFANHNDYLKNFADSIVYISENQLVYDNIIEKINNERIDTMTHLSAYSIAAATILGSLLIGKTTEESLRLARINVENSTLNSCLSLSELEKYNSSTTSDNLELIAASLMYGKKGILAADESGGSIKKKFAQLNIADTMANRHDYRNIFFTTKDIENYLSGVILFDETARDFMNTGESIPDYLSSKRIIPGIKVDQGLETFEGSEETYTKGLTGLEARLREYYQMGLRFAKWRAAFNLVKGSDGNILTPTTHAIEENCRILAEYAQKCQSAGLVPIVEPELVYDGDYTIEDSAFITGKILDTLAKTLADFGINNRACIIKTNMVLAGKKQARQSTPEEVGKATARVLKDHVPADIAGVVFLSGGQTPEQATDNLSAILKNGPFPWPLTFSFARALQDPALFAWAGDKEKEDAAKDAFLNQLKSVASTL